MEKRILFVTNNEDSFLVVAMGKALTEAGYQVFFSPPSPAQIDAAVKVPIYIMYLDGDDTTYKPALEYFSKTISLTDQEHVLYLIGNPIDISIAYKVVPEGLVAAAFERPVNTTDLIEALNRVTSSLSYTSSEDEVSKCFMGEEDGSKKSLLLVDDDSTLLRSMQSWLSKAYNVFITNSGMNALNFLKKRTVDMILLDYEMPFLSGLEVFRSLKSEQDTQDIPVIFLTAKDDKATVMRVLEVKPVNYIVKPIHPALLQQMVDDYFEKQKEAAKEPKKQGSPYDDFLEELETVE